MDGGDWRRALIGGEQPASEAGTTSGLINHNHAKSGYSDKSYLIAFRP